MSLGNAFIKNFLGKAPDWYKVAIISFSHHQPIGFLLSRPICSRLVTRR
ncbi:hypothetical protein QW180_16355 [Vibrio sinaloensis]|nr:hypothetical protein [Vibrio sinaloensis]